MTLDEAFADFTRLAQAYSNPEYIAGSLVNDLDNLAYQMRRLAPQKSGRLRSSIALRAEGSPGQLGVILQMLDYGLYQNFGVGPRARQPFNTLSGTNAPRRQPYGVDVEDQSFGNYQYRDGRRFGLPATVFFDYEQLLNEIATLTEEGFFDVTNEILD